MRLAVVLFSLAFFGLGAYALVMRGTFVEPEAGPSSALVAPTASGGAQATTAAAGGAPTVRTDRDTIAPYRVIGATEAEILRSLVELGPSNEGERFFGMTEADMRLGYRTARTEAECWLVDVEVRLGVTTTLPEWDRPAGAEATLRRDWHRFRSALQRHEGRHKEIVERGAAKVYRAVAGLRAPTCAAVEGEARRRLDRIEIEMEAEHRRYDDQTDHGRTEGAAWPVR